MDRIKEGKELQKKGIEEELAGLKQLDELVENTDLKFFSAALKAYSYATVTFEAESIPEPDIKDEEIMEWVSTTGNWKTTREGRDNLGKYMFGCPAEGCIIEPTNWVTMDSHIREQHSKVPYKCLVCLLWKSTNYDSVRRHERSCAGTFKVEVPERKKDLPDK